MTSSIDFTLSEAIRFLRESGAENISHSGRSLFGHLEETANVLRRWNESEDIVLAGLFHSVYGTKSFKQTLLQEVDRPHVRARIGERAEHLAHLFSIVVPMEVSKEIARRSGRATSSEESADRDENRLGGETEETLQDLLVLHASNWLEQTKHRSGAPASCLQRIHEFSQQIVSREGTLRYRMKDWISPNISLHEELHLLERYLYGVANYSADLATAMTTFEECIRIAPFLGEPRIWLSDLLSSAGDLAGARQQRESAKECFLHRGVTWDKRLPFDRWFEMCSDGTVFAPEAQSIADRVRQQFPTVLSASRFERFLGRVGAERSPDASRWYPQLSASPFHDPNNFSITSTLKERFEEIQAEVNSLEAGLFYSEAEAIHRVGRWEVFMLVEAGRKNEANCKRMPILTQILESSPEVRRSSGLTYLSRLKAGTHVAAHRGGTNLRLRCHFAIQIPAGDCKMRVHDITTGWTAGESMIFDDFYEHEVWNRTEEDRLVLIIDLWHPDLSTEEKACLHSLNWFANRQANGKSHYWKNNEGARRKEDEANSSIRA